MISSLAISILLLTSGCSLGEPDSRDAIPNGNESASAEVQIECLTESNQLKLVIEEISSTQAPLINGLNLAKEYGLEIMGPILLDSLQDSVEPFRIVGTKLQNQIDDCDISGLRGDLFSLGGIFRQLSQTADIDSLDQFVEKGGPAEMDRLLLAAADGLQSIKDRLLAVADSFVQETD